MAAINPGAFGFSQKGLKALFELFSRKSGKLYRDESLPGKLLNRGFDEDFQFSHPNIYGHDIPNPQAREVMGLYTARNPEDVTRLALGVDDTFLGNSNINTELAPLEGARHLSFSPKEWMELSSRYQNDFKLTQDLKKQADFIEFPDMILNYPELRQTVQINPRKSVAKVRLSSGDELYRILGLALGAGGMGGAMGLPDEAEAMPLGKAFQMTGKEFLKKLSKEGALKKGMKSVGPEVSSTAEKLIGTPLQGSKITSVVKGVGDKRYIHVEDGRIFPTDRQSLHELVAEAGTKEYIQKFKDQPSKDAQVLQAMKSLRNNESRTGNFTLSSPRPTKEIILQRSMRDRAGMTQEELAGQYLVQSKRTKAWFMMPKEYTEILEPMGLIKVDRKWDPLKGAK